MSTSIASFLDLLIVIENNKTKLFDKKDSFSFSVVFVRQLDNDIPLNVYCAS